MKLRACVWMMVAGVVLLPSMAVQAGAPELTVNAGTKADLAAATEAVHKQMAPGGRYEFVTTPERGEIDSKLGDMQAMFDRDGSVAAMNQETKIRVFNDQEVVNAILTKRDGDRRTCRSEATTGSLIHKTTCRTYAETQRLQQDSQRFMLDNKMVGSSGPKLSGSGSKPSGGH